jgi:hypothetical protein
MIVYPLSDPQLPSIALSAWHCAIFPEKHVRVEIHSGPECPYPDPDPDEPIHPFPLA